MAYAEELTYRVIDSRRLSVNAHDRIDDLLRQSLAIDYQRPAYEIEHMVQESSLYRHSPNKAVGGQTIRASQGFAKAVNIIALDTSGALVAHVPAADNASSPPLSRLPHVVSDAISAGVRQAKLHAPDKVPYSDALIRRRWLWLGLCGLSAAARESVMETNSSAATVIDGLLAAAAAKRLPQQPVASYPYDDEFPWKKGLAHAGFTPVQGSRMHISAFGPQADYVGQERWVVPDIETMLSTIAAKRGVSAMMAQIMY